MTTDDESDPDRRTEVLERVPTGIAGLDIILHGGLLQGGVYMVLARPGAGKTILGNQMCFRHVASGGKALFVTLLAESHGRLIAQLQSLDFFEPTFVGRGVWYIAGYQPLEKEGLKGILDLLRQLVRERKATLLVIDGIVTAGTVALSEIELKRFVHELQVSSDLLGCTTVLLSGPSEQGSEQYALRTMADGLIEMHLERIEMEAFRSIEVTKLRGSSMLLGRHLFDISSAGITIHPRTEALYGKAMERPDPTHVPLAAFGVDGLDAMLDGGLRSGSITMVLGSPGSGKTLLGLSLLAAGARRGEQGLYFGFFETPSDLCRKAEAIGLGLAEHVKSGRVEILWQSPLEVIADALAAKLLSNIRERRVTRVVVDGLGGFKDSLVYPERARRFFGALCNELRALGVVTLLSEETPTIPEVDTARHGLTAMLDNVILVRHLEIEARVEKRLSVTKMREGAGDPSVRAFSIGARGVVVAPEPANKAANDPGPPRPG